MVESIAPVVYGGRARYRSAVALHAGTAMITGALFGTVLALTGALARAPWGTPGTLVIAILALAYAARELFGLPLPLFDRRQQVPDWWRTFYGPHVAATLYGAGLGVGFLTFLRYGTYLVVCAIALGSGDLRIGALLGGVFGLSRGLTTLMSAGTNDEVEAAAVVERLEKTAVGRAPRTANALVLVAIAVVALATACDTASPSEASVGPYDRSPSIAATGPRTYSQPVTLGHLRDERIEESSGLVASRTHDGVLWTHNDSGDGPYLYALDLRGHTIGRWRVTGAEAIDWEDIAMGPGDDEGDDIYVGDIGDNEATRANITIYRVPEPDPANGTTNTEPAAAMALTYPDGPHDAEALMVHPTTGDLYIVTKQLSGRAAVYETEAPLRDGSQLQRVELFDLPGTFGGITAGDISASGDRLVLATYSGALEFFLPPGATDFDAIWNQEPTAIEIEGRPQGEAIAYDPTGTALLTTSEGKHTPLQLVRAKY